MTPLTPKQQSVLTFIRKGIKAHRPPTVREIMDRFGFKSPNAVANHLKALERKDYILRYPKRARAIELTAKGKWARGIPVVGEVT